MSEQFPSVATRLSAEIKSVGISNIWRKSGVPLRTLRNYMHGRPPKFDVLIRIASACGFSLDWLATGEGSRRAAGLTFCSEIAAVRRIEPAVDEPTASDAEYFPGHDFKPIVHLSPEMQAVLLQVVYELAFADDADAEIGPHIRGFYQAAYLSKRGA